MNLCVYDRRNREVCHDLNITLWACFQTPNCTDQSNLDLYDTFGTYTGHGGSTNVIFTQKYDPPSGHFVDFSSSWHDLTWTFDENQFPEATINSDSGDIYITRNISIWPAWPTKEYRQVVRLSNSESCYTTMCSFRIIVHFTNWPIIIRSLPTSYSLHEDYDRELLLHELVVSDYNYASEDNMTCEIYDWFPKEADMFQLRHDGNYANDSYTLYKLACQDPDCGYKYADPQPYYCHTDIGCLTYNRTQQYTITIKCSDAYNSTDYADFTFNVIPNGVPSFVNLPAHIDLNSWLVAQHDKIFEIMYSDLENEDLMYEYKYTDEDTKENTTYFIGSTRGNYFDNRGNISVTTNLWNTPFNKTYMIHICGHERRNEICTELTVELGSRSEGFCGTRMPVMKICTDANLTNHSTVNIDSSSVPVSQTNSCKCKILPPGIDVQLNVTYIGESNDEFPRFQINDIVFPGNTKEPNNTKTTTLNNDSELLFVSSARSERTAVCLTVSTVNGVKFSLTCSAPAETKTPVPDSTLTPDYSTSMISRNAEMTTTPKQKLDDSDELKTDKLVIILAAVIGAVVLSISIAALVISVKRYRLEKESRRVPNITSPLEFETERTNTQGHNHEINEGFNAEVDLHPYETLNMHENNTESNYHDLNSPEHETERIGDTGNSEPEQLQSTIM